MHLLKSFHQKHTERLAKDFVFVIAEDMLRLIVEQDDPLSLIHRDDGAAGAIKNALKAGLGGMESLYDELALGFGGLQRGHLRTELFQLSDELLLRLSFVHGVSPPFFQSVSTKVT
jgi:hypothetical protein